MVGHLASAQITPEPTGRWSMGLSEASQPGQILYAVVIGPVVARSRILDPPVMVRIDKGAVAFQQMVDMCGVEQPRFENLVQQCQLF